MAFDKLRQEWSDMDPKFRYVIVAIAVCGIGMVTYRALQPADKPQTQESKPTAMVDENGRAIDPMRSRLLPDTPRNQGLENITTDVEGLKSEIGKLKTMVETLPRPENRMAAAKADYEARAASAPASAGSAPAIDLDARLPGANSPISFDPPGAGKKAANASGTAASAPASDTGNTPVQMKTWPADDAAEVLKSSALGAMVIPVNSALEAVALSGFNARPSGSTTGAAGSVVSANQVGAPFVTRIKGEALLPNGWRLADLGDCSLGGSAIAVLSTERANVIANTLSCIGANGEVWEAPIEAYGLDVDGTLGIAGKVVSKQGSLLLQASLTAMASGLGNALSPTSVPSYNSSATNGSTSAVQYPNLPGLAQTLVGQGINQATAQLSKFYLDYAKEVFPVVEVTSGTRVTWVLTKSIELKRSGTGLAGAL